MGRDQWALVSEGNFVHLAELDGPLASLGGFAEASFLDDANISLIKARQFAERLALVVAERHVFVAEAQAAGKEPDLDEGDTRLLIDERLRNAGWEADTSTLRHALGTRPEKGRNLAIAEWPTAAGPADYALVCGLTLAGMVEAKRKRKDVAAALDQADR
ncbi:MAG: hypothetical protein R6V44_08940 [Paracoccaceae bacterium]